MSISPGFTTEQIREFVHQYEIQPYGQKAVWLVGQGVSYDRLRRWRSAVFDGDLDRGLIPREGGVVTVPPEKRSGIERQRANERAAQEAELARLNARVRELEETNAALGRAIGLLGSRPNTVQLDCDGFFWWTVGLGPGSMPGSF